MPATRVAAARDDREPGRRAGCPPSRRDELPLGEDAIGLVSESPDRGAHDRTTEDRRRPPRSSEAAEAYWTPTAGRERTAAAEPPTRPTTRPPSRTTRAGRARRARGPARAGRRRPAAAPRSPSWDEIMFGGGKPRVTAARWRCRLPFESPVRGVSDLAE